MKGQRLLVFGPTALVVVVVALLAAAVGFEAYGNHAAALSLVAAVVSRALPLARGRGAKPGRKADIVRVVTRRPRVPLPPPPAE